MMFGIGGFQCSLQFLLMINFWLQSLVDFDDSRNIIMLMIFLGLRKLLLIRCWLMFWVIDFVWVLFRFSDVYIGVVVGLGEMRLICMFFFVYFIVSVLVWVIRVVLEVMQVVSLGKVIWLRKVLMKIMLVGLFVCWLSMEKVFSVLVLLICYCCLNVRLFRLLVSWVMLVLGIR